LFSKYQSFEYCTCKFITVTFDWALCPVTSYGCSIYLWWRHRNVLFACYGGHSLA